MIRFSPPYIDDDIIKEVTTILQSGWLTTGPATKQLEKEMALFCKIDLSPVTCHVVGRIGFVLYN